MIRFSMRLDRFSNSKCEVSKDIKVKLFKWLAWRGVRGVHERVGMLLWDEEGGVMVSLDWSVRRGATAATGSCGRAKMRRVVIGASSMVYA